MTTECLLSVVVREILFTSRVVVVVIVVNLGPLLTGHILLSDTEFKGEGPAPSGSRPPLVKAQ